MHDMVPESESKRSFKSHLHLLFQTMPECTRLDMVFGRCNFECVGVFAQINIAEERQAIETIEVFILEAK